MAVAAFVGLIWVTGGNVSDMQALTQASQTGMLDSRGHVGHEQREPTLGISRCLTRLCMAVGAFLGRFFLKKPSWLMLGLAAIMALGMSPVLISPIG